MFRTRVIPSASEHKINLNDMILALGSCFAQNIGQKLKDYKFKANINPFGTLFNPLSIFKLINQAAQGGIIDSKGIVEQQGIFHHYDLHSDFSKLNEDEVLSNANHVLQRMGKVLPENTYVIYTFGTAIAYELKETGEIVANCHKVPAAHFNRRMLSVDEIVNAFAANYELIKGKNKKTRFILTVSPVRHQKESFEQNNVSKSTLRLACEQIVQHHEDIEYFPAFEIMMDELRDYRFYAEDMLHPNSVATDFIWKKFQDVYFDEEHKDFLRKWDKIRKAMAHRPVNKGSEQHQLFLEKTIRQLEEFKDKIDISVEYKLLKDQLL